MGKLSLISEMKAVGTAKSLINRALSFVKNAETVPTSLSSEMTHKIAQTARELGFSTKLFEKPIVKAITLLQMDEESVLGQFEAAIAADIAKYTNALPESEKKVIKAVKDAGVKKLQVWLRAYKAMKADLKEMLKYQGTTLDKFVKSYNEEIDKANRELEAELAEK